MDPNQLATDIDGVALPAMEDVRAWEEIAERSVHAAANPGQLSRPRPRLNVSGAARSGRKQ